MRQITIIGLGTIGGSLGMALEQAIAAEKGRGGDVAVVGYDQDPNVVEEALVRGAINRIARTLPEAVQQADLVILAQSAPAVGETLRQIGFLLPAGCVVTDTASNKAEVMHWAEQYLPAGFGFIGGHPIPLPQQEVHWETGIKAARPDLFRGGIYCLAPAVNASEQDVNMVRNLALLVGSDPFFVDALEHDALLAGLIQAPYVVAAAMLSTIAESSSWRDLKLLADPTFRQLSQMVISRPADFHQSCTANRQLLLSWLDRVISTLWDVRQEMASESGSGEYLRGVADKARAAYQDWSRRRDERRKELAAVTATQRLPSAKETFLGLFLPRRGMPREKRRE